ncbi:G-type lectin S-receptor-like serine/threonine-protein kinase SD2-5 [Lycium ferocissimum]|uniref:G-type lectin S-receptor-like serine/threonine-protein kinase SD2-5 n=1 Tax=Lycium ferocissimum TaxID=112874 RepID=UPI002814C951|nr:G-type lectin S-receptor-like serine/threonine-protein kinase SD2-5 [Lycium ferocissimum]
MGSWRSLYLVIIFLFVIFVPETLASVQNKGRLNLGFKGSQMTWIDNNGLILVSNSSKFAFGFNPTKDVTSFLLVVIHVSSSTIIWSANRDSPVKNSDNFMFDKTGNAYLQSEGSTIWSTNTASKGVSVMELRDSGNLILLGNDGTTTIWESFSHPVDTLLSNQNFTQGMKLVSSPNNNNLSYSLEFKSGDMVLSASFKPPQPYWTMGKDERRTINQVGEGVTTAILDGNSWKIYDRKGVLLWQFIFPDNKVANATRLAVLGEDGYISFSTLQDGSIVASPTRIPQDECSRPTSCDPLFICYSGNRCQCPSALPSCKPETDSFCSKPKDHVELVEAGDKLGYSALEFVSPSAKTDLNGCKASCLGNCSCAAMFFDSSSGNCLMFDQIGSLQGSISGAVFKSYIKVSASQANRDSGGGGKGRLPIILGIVISTALVILGLIYGGIRCQRRKNKLPDSAKASSEEDNFLEGLSGMPIRFSYKDLQNATNNFSIKLGQGGFGSVYQGVLPDGSRLAVKKLEGIGQGKKEFRAEVSIIGSIHHLHLVRLRGFCAEGTHRLLAYEYMANGSLEKWLFKKNKEFMLDWDTRFNIAVGTAKGLAYLHEDCDVKIVHCDIKPENVLLDDHFLAKVSDFGLAKLMTREQSHVFTTMRGTRGYLAPEWITNYAISEKSDVFSYGMVLLEIIGGRKNYDPSESSEKSHFPSYAFKMMEKGKLTDLIDRNLKVDEEDERVSIAIKVALWCIQDDMSLRPSMAKVVQMLERLCHVPSPPTTSQMGTRLFSGFLKSLSGDGTSSGTSGPSDCNSDAYLSAVRLSGPR